MQLSNSAGQACDLLAYGVAVDAPLPAALLAAYGSALSDLATQEKFTGKAGSRLVIPAMGKVEAKWVALLGTGDGSVSHVRGAAGAAGFLARDKGAASMTLHLAGGEAHATAAAEAVVTGNYRYDEYKPESARKTPLASVAMLGLDAPAEALNAGAAMGTARALARDLINGPPDDIYPETLAAAAVALAGDRMTVDVWDYERLLSEGMTGTVAVGQGSDRKPRFVHMVYTPAGESTGEVALVGKGVTFDAGGLSLKPTGGMLTMKCDMSGAAAVVGVMSGLEALGCTATVHGIFAAAENMVSGNSYKLGDVLRFSNGKTVEIHNTDAEGRLLLADCLCFASKLPNVTHVIDLATLTGAAVVALGEHYTATYANSDEFAQTLVATAKASGEGFWHMPLEPLYDDLLKSDIADIKNVGGRAAGSITAALFLQNFVSGGKTWSHLDIAGPAFLSKPEGHLDKGGAGPAVVTLLNWATSL
jgi:leucyl aminopeptidase